MLVHDEYGVAYAVCLVSVVGYMNPAVGLVSVAHVAPMVPVNTDYGTAVCPVILVDFAVGQVVQAGVMGLRWGKVWPEKHCCWWYRLLELDTRVEELVWDNQHNWQECRL